MLISRFPPTVGGTEIQCSRLTTWLAGHGHQLVVLTEKSSEDQPTHERINGFEVVRFRTWGAPPWSSICYAFQTFLYLLRHPRFDVLHAHMLATPAVVASVAGLFSRSPVIVKIAGGRQTGDFNTSRRTPLGRMKVQLLKRIQPFFVCPNQEILEEGLSAGLPGSKLWCIPNGIDTDYFRPANLSKSRIRESLGLPDMLTAIYVGRWAKGKGVEKVLEIWERGASQANFPWHLLLVLSENPPETIAARIRNLRNSIHSVTGIADPLPYYQASDLAVLLSEGEGMSNFLLEAMACGLPTLTSPAAALPAAEGNNTGACTLSSNELAVKEGGSFLSAMPQSPERLSALGEASRKHAVEKYSLHRIGEMYISLYEKIAR